MSLGFYGLFLLDIRSVEGESRILGNVCKNIICSKEVLSVNISTRKQEGVYILDLDGKLVSGASPTQLARQIQAALGLGERQILINMGGVDMMDSSGLGELVALQKAASKVGAAVKLLHVEDKVREVFELASLIGVFETFDNEVMAIASFRD